jgi:uncharacterized RDD family membrane protein YckC
VNLPESDIGVAMDVRVGVRSATVGSRALAQAIDLALVQILQMLIGGCGIGIVFVIPFNDYTGWAVALVLVLAVLVPVVWFVGYEIAWDGQTPGKRWIGLRVVTEDGRVPDSGAIIVRNLMRLVDFLPGAYLVGVVAMLVSNDGRRLGDLVAGTRVVAEEKAAPPARRWAEGLSDTEVRLLEAYFARAPVLDASRREELAEKLLIRLGRDKNGSAVGTLEALCPREAT